MQHNVHTEGSGVICCDHCGAENFAFASFCIGCGQALDADSLALFPGAQRDDGVSPPREDLRRPKAKSPINSWETWLGVAILLAALCYLAFDWHRSNLLSTAYNLGADAAQRKDWDAALDHFAQADGYMDAQSRLEQARSAVSERDSMYYQALEAAEMRDWQTVVSALEQVQSIQPEFGDSAARLQQAREQLFKQGTSGIVYLMAGGSSPGLYVRDAEGRVTYLPGSDKYSTVRATAPDGTWLVYDAPETPDVGTGSSSRAPVETPARSGASALGSAVVRRIPVLASLGADGEASAIPLSALDGKGLGVFSEQGLWWHSSHNAQSSLGLFASEVFYYRRSLTDTAGITEMRYLASDKRVVAHDLANARVVMTQPLGEGRTSTLRTRLYLAGALGQSPRLLQTVAGEVYQASISRDGRWLLFITQQNGPEITRSVQVMALDGLSQGGQAIAIELERVSWSGIQNNGRLTASFVPVPSSGSAARPARVIVNRAHSGQEVLTVHDLSSGEAREIWRTAFDGTTRRDLSGFSPDGNFLGIRLQDRRGAVVRVLDLREDSSQGSGVRGQGSVEWHTHIPALLSQMARVSFSPRGDYVLTSIQNPDGMNRGHTQALYSARHQDGERRSTALLIATVGMPHDRDLNTIALPNEGSFVVYVNAAQELRAVRYDGTGDTLLSEGVKAVWSLQTRRDLSWWR